jgi:hypothetical protein
VQEGIIEDQLVVSYSAGGLGGPWIVAQTLTEGIELPAGWTRKFLNLAGLSAVDDNPGFALRFQWQFNHERDTGRLDSVRLLSGAVTGPDPAIGLSAVRLERTLELGEDLAGDSFFVSNTGEGVLDFTVSEDLPWLTVSPAADSSPGPPRRVGVIYHTSGLAPGDHEGSLEVASTNGTDSPQTVTVLLHVVPPARFRDGFSYYDGELTTMGGANWSGTATGQLLVENGLLEVRGGAGASAAAHLLPAGGPEGTFEVSLKVQKGPGTGDFFWNVAIDDDSGDSTLGNLARWYGGSTIVRGRVGGSITPDLVLTGEGTWDDLRVRIDVAANTSEFFFNGVSRGVIAHGTGPGNRPGAIRIERFDRAGTGGDRIRFDDLVVGNVALRLFHRADPDSSGATDLADAVAILNFLFRRGAAPACAESADSNDDGQIDLSDALRILFYLFGGPSPPQPGPPGSPCGAGRDAPGSAGDLGCDAYGPCEL